MFAQAQILGNLGQEPELKNVNGKNVVNFTLATNEKVNGVERTHWWNIAAWERLADVVAQYCHKGSKILVHGRLSTRKYVDRDNVERTVVELTATAIELVDTRQAQNGAATGSNGSTTTSTPSSATPSAHRPGVDDPLPTDDDNDLPF